MRYPVGTLRTLFRKFSGAGGFSAVELAVTMSVVGIVASMAVPYYVDNTSAARSATCSVTRDSIRRAAIHYMNNHELETGASLPSLADLVSEGLLNDTPDCPSNGSYVWLDDAVVEGKTPDLGCSIHYWPAQASQESSGASPLYTSAFDSMAGLKSMAGKWSALNGTLTPTKGGRISFGSSDWSDFDMKVNATNLKGKGFDVYYRGSLSGNGKKFQTGYKLKFDAKKGRLLVQPVIGGKVKKAIASYKLPSGFPTRGQSHDISISVQGTSHTVSIDSQAVMNFTDSRYTSGVAGLGSGKNNSTFSGVSVTEPTG